MTCVSIKSGTKVNKKIRIPDFVDFINLVHAHKIYFSILHFVARLAEMEALPFRQMGQRVGAESHLNMKINASASN